LEARGIAPDSSEGQEDLAWARDWILNAMIEQTLTEQAAAAAGITVSEDAVDAYMQDMIAENGGEDAFLAKLEQFGDTYENARQTVRLQLIGGAMRDRIIEAVPTTTEHVHARHILADTAEEAEHILGQLRAGADFAALARTYSQDDSTRESGGDLGFFPQGILIAPEVEAAAFALQPGQFSEVVVSSLGYHIVQVVERDPARSVSPDSLRYLREQAVQNWTKELWSQADVQRFIEPTTP
jgi:parvulin-like peptidyl-prolyl isomerase